MFHFNLLQQCRSSPKANRPKVAPLFSLCPFCFPSKDSNEESSTSESILSYEPRLGDPLRLEGSSHRRSQRPTINSMSPCPAVRLDQVIFGTNTKPPTDGMATRHRATFLFAFWNVREKPRDTFGPPLREAAFLSQGCRGRHEDRR